MAKTDDIYNGHTQRWQGPTSSGLYFLLRRKSLGKSESNLTFLCLTQLSPDTSDTFSASLTRQHPVGLELLQRYYERLE